MELSKYGNENSDSENCDKKLIEQFFEHSKLNVRNYFVEELTILDPDIIITANLWDISTKISNYILEFISKKMNVKIINEGEKVYLRSIEINNKTIPIFNTYHFSSSKCVRCDFYEPIQEIFCSDKFKKIFNIPR